MSYFVDNQFRIEESYLFVVTNKFYEWWGNHRKVVTYGAFIILFGFYLSPVVKEANYKNQCIKYSTKGALTKFNKDNIGETLFEETGLNVAELAQIEGYKNCIN